MSKGTIIYIGGFELPDKNAAAHRVIGNGKALRDLGFNVVYIGIQKEASNESTIQNHFGFTSYGVPYPTSNLSWFKYITASKLYIDIIKNEKEIHALILYDLPAVSIFRLLKYAKKGKIKIFSDCTEWYGGSFNGNIPMHIIKFTDSLFRMRFLQPRLDGMIAISEYLYDYYKKKRTAVIKIPPLVDKLDAKWINELEKKNKKIQIVYAGGAFSLDNRYVKDRLDLVVEALVLIKKKNFNFIFKVVGCTKKDFEIFYPHLVSCIRYLKSDILFHGKVPHEQAISIVKDSNYSIFIRDESIVTLAGFPTKFVESISCGVPVITNRNSNVADYIEEGENGFIIHPTSVFTITNKLIEILSIDEQKQFAMQKDTYESSLFDYRNFYEEFKKLLN